MQAKSGDLKRMEEQLSDHLTAAVEVRIKKTARGGQIQSGELAIGFGSLDELNGLIERLHAA
jgi:ParB family chromosome partitioning protein